MEALVFHLNPGVWVHKNKFYVPWGGSKEGGKRGGYVEFKCYFWVLFLPIEKFFHAEGSV